MADRTASEDPWAVLGIAEGASPDEIRRAYLQQVKAHPPEREAAAFERIRDAYSLLREPGRRIARQLLRFDPNAPLTALLDQREVSRRPTGPAVWLAALEEL